jgi:predicted RNA binding protein YcfA (HicA-like mRNA interferase family)
MNSRQRKSLEALFRDPPPLGMEWSDIEALLVALGATIVEGRGSRVRFVLNQAVATFHRPHPSKDAKPCQVQDARSFLEQAGITP